MDQFSRSDRLEFWLNGSRPGSPDQGSRIKDQLKIYQIKYQKRNFHIDFKCRHVIAYLTSLRASSPIWASEVSLARTRTSPFLGHSQLRRSLVFARLASLAQTGELARRLIQYILGDPGAVIRVDKMFVVKVYCKIETSKLSPRTFYRPD